MHSYTFSLNNPMPPGSIVSSDISLFWTLYKGLV